MDSEDEYKSDEGDSEDEYSDCFACDEEQVRYSESPRDSAKPEDDHWVERYTILMQEAHITQVSNTLRLPRLSAIILLRHYDWEVDTAQDAWFADQEKVRKDVGLLEKQVKVEVPIQNTEDTIKCRICLDEFPHDGMCAATTCGHLFCNLCWTQYIGIKLSDGPGCLMLGCPDPSCVVGEDMVNELVSDEDRKKYSRYLYSSFDDDKKRTKQCPRPGCEFAVEFVAGSTSYDVVCRCGHSFCWNCVEDAHRPADCDTVHKWAVKNTAQSENVIWMLANSKSCPKCRQPIQKNEGYSLYMTCSCRFQFCWLCLGDWSTHGRSTGGYFACNVYKKAKVEGLHDEEENIRKKAKDYLDRYDFYYKRFEKHHKSRLKAVERLRKLKAKDLAKLSYRYSEHERHLEFITDAWLQIIECRRVLQWTNVYGYYLPTSENAKTAFFSYLQGEAESGFEKLHRCAKVELQYLEECYDASEEAFNSFRGKLVGLTSVTKKYFENLVHSLENGLSEVRS